MDKAAGRRVKMGEKVSRNVGQLTGVKEKEHGQEKRRKEEKKGTLRRVQPFSCGAIEKKRNGNGESKKGPLRKEGETFSFVDRKKTRLAHSFVPPFPAFWIFVCVCVVD